MDIKEQLKDIKTQLRLSMKTGLSPKYCVVERGCYTNSISELNFS